MTEEKPEERIPLGVQIAARATGMAIATTAIAIAGPVVVGVGLVALLVGIRIATPDE